MTTPAPTQPTQPSAPTQPAAQNQPPSADRTQDPGATPVVGYLATGIVLLLLALGMGLRLMGVELSRGAIVGTGAALAGVVLILGSYLPLRPHRAARRPQP